jgi:hypothetical protein
MEKLIPIEFPLETTFFLMLNPMPKMSPDFALSLLEKLNEPILRVRIEMNEHYGGNQKFPNGREVHSIVKTIYTWKDEEIANIKGFTEWLFAKELRFEFGPSKYLIVNENMTHISVYGFTLLPDLKTCNGQPPHTISIYL